MGQNQALTSVISFVKKVNDVIINPIILLLISVAAVVFLWGVLQYVVNADDEAKRAQGKQLMIWGIVGLFVMVSVKGILIIVLNTFGISTPIGL